jgi:hypothetical protein
VNVKAFVVDKGHGYTPAKVADKPAAVASGVTGPVTVRISSAAHVTAPANVIVVGSTFPVNH